jgi:hypothetical protein
MTKEEFAKRSCSEPIPECGKLMTIQEFEKNCEVGMFIDDDGFGCLAVADSMSAEVLVNPSDVPLPDLGFTHVVWFNR